jgi:hypothetical protein
MIGRLVQWVKLKASWAAADPSMKTIEATMAKTARGARPAEMPVIHQSE